MLKIFSNNIRDIINDYKDDKIDSDIEDTIIKYHNKQKRLLKRELKEIYDELGNEDFRPSFYNHIESVFERQMKKIEKFLY